MAAKWWFIASLLLCLAVAPATARTMPRDCDTATFEAVAGTAGVVDDDDNAGAVDESKTADVFGGRTSGGGLYGGVQDDNAGAVDESKTADVFGGRTSGGGLFGGVHGPLGGGVAGFGPFGGAVAGAAPFLGFGGGAGLGGGGGGGGGGAGAGAGGVP